MTRGITSEQYRAMTEMMSILRVAGTWKIPGRLLAYNDPWGGGLTLSMEHRDGKILLSAESDEAVLLSATLWDDSGDVALHRFDETTAWTLYLGACYADVEANYERQYGQPLS